MSSNVLGKPLTRWTAADVQSICSEAMQESADLELKKALSTKNNRPDPWIVDQSSIGEEAKTKLVKEVIAFANAHGGVLILGIEETPDKPARAKSIVPLPKCAELADRLRLVCRDLIEPKLAVMEVEGVATSDDGAGVVVFRVPPSRLAPHRHIGTRECYVRHADRSEKMTMREIQDLVLFVERGLSSIEEVFETRERLLTSRASTLPAPGMSFLLRVTTIPLIPLGIHRVHGRADARPEVRTFKSGRGDELKCLTWPPDRWKPCIGGTRSTVESGHRTLEIELHRSGQLEYTYMMKAREDGGQHLFLSWFLGLVCSAILSTHKFRVAAGAPSAEVGIDIDLRVVGSPIGLMRLGDRHGLDSIADLPSGQHRLPRYSLGEASEMSKLVDEIVRDLANAGESDFEVDLAIDFDSHLKSLGML